MTKAKHVKAGNVTFGNDLPLALIAGPCQMESRDHAMDVAGKLVEIAKEKKIGLVYKTSYDKANRTSMKGKRGMGLEASLAVFDEIRKTYKIRRSPTCMRFPIAPSSRRWWTYCKSPPSSAARRTC